MAGRGSHVMSRIRDFPDHATFREKGATLAVRTSLEFSSL